MKDFFSTIVNVILWVVMLVLLFLVTSGVYQRFFNSENHTGFFGIGYAVVVSGSMEPNIHVDDMIVYQRRDVNDLNPGEVIVYLKKDAQGEMLVTHRILEKTDKTLVTKGDANTVTDAPISYDQVVGKVVWRIPFVGKIVGFVKTIPGLIVVVAGIIALFIVNILISKSRRKKKVDTVMGKQNIEY